MISMIQEADFGTKHNNAHNWKLVKSSYILISMGSTESKQNQQPYYPLIQSANFYSSIQYHAPPAQVIQRQGPNQLSLNNAQEILTSTMRLRREIESISLHKSAFKNLDQFISKIVENIKSNEKIYSQFFNIHHVIIKIKQFQSQERTKSQVKKFIGFIMNSINSCIEKYKNKSQMDLNFGYSFQKLLDDMLELMNISSQKSSKIIIKQLSYIIKDPKSGRSQYSHSFHDLKFILDIKNTRDVAEDVKKMVGEDSRAFCFLTNYLYNCCVELSRNGASMSQISTEYGKILTQLSSIYKPSCPFDTQDPQLTKHLNEQHFDLLPKYQYDITKYKAIHQKIQNFDFFIIRQAKKAQKQMPSFISLFEQICKKNNGENFKSSLKLQGWQNTKAITRIKEKMLKSVFRPHQISRILQSQLNDQHLDSFIDFYSYTMQGYEQYKRRLHKKYIQMQRPIQFKITDMLRGKATFSSLRHLNNCCSDIKKAITDKNQDGIQLIQIENRLKGQTCDLVMKVRLNQTIAELQLVFALNEIDYGFMHKFYELQRNKCLPRLTHLALFNEDITRDYLTESRIIVLQKIRQNADYQGKVIAKEIAESFKIFASRLEVRINFWQKHKDQVEIDKFPDQQRIFRQIQASTIQKNQQYQKNWRQQYNENVQNGKKDYDNGQYLKAILLLRQIMTKFQAQKHDILTKVDNNYNLEIQQQNQVEIYQRNLQYCGLSYQKLQDYEEALKMFKVRQISCKLINGNQSVGAALSLKDIAFVYRRQNKHKQALDQYEKCVQILSKKGRSYNLAEIYSSMGSVYEDMGQYQKALKKYNQALGQSSLDRTIQAQARSKRANILIKFQRQQQALKQYLQCLKIYKHTSINSLAIAETYTNIGKICQIQEKYQQALSYYNRSLQFHKNISIQKAEVHKHIGSTHIFLSRLYKEQGQWDKWKQRLQKAITSYSQCLEVQQIMFGKGSEKNLVTTTKLGEMCYHTGDYYKVLHYCSKAVRIYERQRKFDDNYQRVLSYLQKSQKILRGQYLNPEAYSSSIYGGSNIMESR